MKFKNLKELGIEKDMLYEVNKIVHDYLDTHENLSPFEVMEEVYTKTKFTKKIEMFWLGIVAEHIINRIVSLGQVEDFIISMSPKKKVD